MGQVSSRKQESHPKEGHHEAHILQEWEAHMELRAIIKKGEKQFVALCPELDVVSQGYTVEEALENLKEATELYIEEGCF